MNLDKGVCSVFRREDSAQSGDMPRWTYTLYYQSWYGEPDFATSPAWPTDKRRENRTDARIRVLQNRDIRENDAVVLRAVRSWAETTQDDKEYRITRAWHGQDDDGPTLITDLSLMEVSP